MLVNNYKPASKRYHSKLQSTISLCLLLGALLVSGCGGGGGSGGSSSEKVEISGAILIPGGVATDANPIGLQGAANRPVSLYQIDDDGNIVGDVIDSGTSDSAGNYVLLLPDNVDYSSALIVEAQLENDQSARAIVIDESTDITPITEYITQELIDDPDLDLGALPLEEVEKLIEFVESLPLGPQPDLTSMLAEIEDFSAEAIEAQINDLTTSNPQIRLSGLLSVPSNTAPRGDGLALRPIPNNDVELFRIDDIGNPVGPAIATTTTNSEGVFTLLLPEGQELSADLMLQAIVDGNTVRALVTSEVLNIDATSEYLTDQITQTPDLDLDELPVSQLNDIVEYVYSLDIAETNDLTSTLANIETVAGPEVSNQIDNVIVLANVTAPVVTAAGPFDLAENSANSTSVVTVTATDVDPVGGVTGFSITAGNTGNAFAIANNGAITVANSAALDRETTASFTLTITATDGTNISAGESIVINLTDLNDTAPVIAAGQTFAVSSSVTNGTVVGTVNATDADITGSVTGFNITAGNTGNVFAIAGNGQITVADNTSLLANGPYTLTLTATDGSNVSAAETVGVTVTVVSNGAVWDNFDWDDGSTWQ